MIETLGKLNNNREALESSPRTSVNKADTFRFGMNSTGSMMRHHSGIPPASNAGENFNRPQSSGAMGRHAY